MTANDRAWQSDRPGSRAVLCTIAAAALASAAPVAAQDAGAAAATADRIEFAADTLAYDQNSDVVTASGAVQLYRDGITLRAEQVTWNRASGQVVATGDVEITNPGGDKAYGDRIELTDSLRDGVIDNILVVTENQARLAAARGVREADGDIVLERAAYTPCPVVGPDGCPRRPSWQIRAARVTYDRARDKIRYRGARVELFGMPLIPLPGLSHAAGGSASSGVLVPDVRIDRTNGVELALPYLVRMGPNRDLTITPHVYTNTAPMLSGQYRALNRLGAFQVTGHATYGSFIPVDGPVDGARRRDFRGAIDASGTFQLDPRWRVQTSVRAATDRTFMRRYDLGRDDRLRSMVSLERNGGSSYLMIQGWATQTLRAYDPQGQQPVALPLIDFRQRLHDPLLGGRVTLQANTLALTRSSGQDTQRAFASAQWDRRYLTGMGQELALTALARGDVYHSDENALTPVLSYRGNSGWQGRAIAAVAADAKWPLTGPLLGGTQILTPRIQIAGTPPIRNQAIPNEDSRALELDDSNIFALNRFPGYDRFEDGVRVTYGFDWSWNRPGIAINSTVGQSYRLSNKPMLFPDGTALGRQASDIVGRTTVAYRDFVRLTHRFRLDKDTLAARRTEVDATIGSRRTYAEVGYMKLNRNILSLAEDLRDREELRIGGRVAIDRNWSAFGSAIVDLTGPAEDPTVVTDGFEPMRHRLGIAYDDDCIAIAITWRRDYVDRGDARRGNSFLFRLAFRNLGF